MIKFASFSIVLLLLACSSPKAVGLDVRPATKNSIKVENNGIKKSTSLNHRVDAFEVKCDKSLIIVWGEAHPLKKLGAIPFNGVTIISLSDMRPLSSFTLSRGPFEVKFTRDGSAVLIDESLFNIKSRKMTDQSADSIEISLLDKCPDFKGKYFGRIDSMISKLLPNS